MDPVAIAACIKIASICMTAIRKAASPPSLPKPCLIADNWSDQEEVSLQNPAESYDIQALSLQVGTIVFLTSGGQGRLVEMVREVIQSDHQQLTEP